MSPRTVSDLILEQLAAYGVRFIYGVIGDAIFPLADALARQQTIRFIPATIENTAAMMAAFSGQLTGIPGVCIGTSGPGAASLANGTASAWVDQIPLLCLTGQVARQQFGTEAKQYFNQRQLFGAVSATTELCIDARSIVPVLSRLLNQAISGPTAVHLEVPNDILAQETDAIPVQAPPLLPTLNSTAYMQGPLDTLMDWPRNARRPLFLIGKEARGYGAVLADLAADYGAGLIISQENKGGLPDRHPLVLGGISEAYVPDCLARADFILEFGQTTAEESFLPDGIKVIRCSAGLGPAFQKFPTIQGDLGTIIAKLRQSIPGVTPREEWRTELERCRQNRLQMVDNLQDPCHPAVFFKALSAQLPPDALIALDTGEHTYWFDFGFIAQNQRVLMSTRWRSMGTAIPAGIAACFQQPAQKTVAVVGDGGFLMSLAELATVVRYQLPLTIFVLRNHQYGLEVQKMRQQRMTTLGTDLALPDLTRLGEAFGIQTYQIDEPDKAGDLIRRSLETGPALVDVKLNSYPLPHLKAM